jgi:hypothetical protein
MSATVRHLFTQTERTVDHSTGEVTQEQHTTTSRAPAEPAYVKVYIDNVGSIEGLATPQKSLLYELILRLGYNGTIQITPMERKKIIKKLDISEKTFRNQMTAIIKTGLIIRHSPSDYEANPFYFARGKWREIMDRRQNFEMRVLYKADGGREVATFGTDATEL